MGIVMPSIFARASAMHEVDYNSDDDSDSSDDVYCFFNSHPIIKEEDGTRTTLLQEKADAAFLMLVYASHCPVSYMPFVEHSAKLFVQDMHNTIHEGFSTLLC